VIYYARKHRPQPPEAKVAEANLLSRIGPATYQRNLLIHRLTKPLVNLRRKLRKAG
jgi:hypothetical protein